jgi:hypothetical protein
VIIIDKRDMMLMLHFGVHREGSINEDVWGLCRQGMQMNYFGAMKDVLQLDEAVYSQLMTSGKIVRYCMLNVLALGMIHALFSLYFSGLLWSGEIRFVEKFFFAAAGVGVAFLLHAGAGLFLWVFTRGAGGRIEFLPVYFNMGISMIGLWPVAPVLSAVQAGFRGPGLYFLLGATSIYGLAVIFFGAKSASQLSMVRMTAALAVCIMVVGSMLYIWL